MFVSIKILIAAYAVGIGTCTSDNLFFDWDDFHNGHENSQDFTNEWAASVSGGPNVAQLLALELGYKYGGQIPDFPDTYVFIKDDHAVQRRNPSHIYTKKLTNDHRISWAEQLFVKSRMKRDFVYPESALPDVAERSRRADIKAPSQKTFGSTTNSGVRSDTRILDDLPRLDLNVLPVYASGITGAGVRVSILDDGLEHDHDDLKDNYEAAISWDSNDGDADPMPRLDEERRNAHGTRCAGEISMVANNGKCGVGVAYGSRVGGVRMLDGRVNDRVEGEALGYAWDKVDIYSASWGPNDDGRTVEGPGRLASQAIERAVHQGRGGKGAIFVWANGNGEARATIVIAMGSASQQGDFPWYGEVCASTLAVTYSSGAYEDQMIATTDLNNECTVQHTGTSASAPLAAGIIALALEANTNLTWRDVQHLIVWTSEYAPVADNFGWQTNRAGFRFDVRFGFGLMNAHALVEAAKTWITVPEKMVCKVEGILPSNVTLSSGRPLRVMFYTEGCGSDKSGDQLNYLEHVELRSNILYSDRGALEVYLTSPGGTRIQMLSPRKLDHSDTGFINWRFMSVGTWGETPHGVWIAEIMDSVGTKQNRGLIGPFTLILHGTVTKPDHMQHGPRRYNYDYNIKELLQKIAHAEKASLTPQYETNNRVYNSIDRTKADASHWLSETSDSSSNNEAVVNDIKHLFDEIKHLDENKFKAQDLASNEILMSAFDSFDNEISNGIFDDEKSLYRVNHQIPMLNEGDY